jgi:hypothetical protein
MTGGKLEDPKEEIYEPIIEPFATSSKNQITAINNGIMVVENCVIHWL